MGFPLARRQKIDPDGEPAGQQPDRRLVNASSDYIFSAVMFLIAAVTPWYFELPLNFNVNSPDFNPLIFLPVVFAGIGAIMLARTVLGVVRAGKFGNATLSPTSASRGEIFKPTMRSERDIATTGDFVLTLKCIRRSSGGDEFEGGTSSDKVLWKHSERCPASPRSGSGVTAAFQIPRDALPSHGRDPSSGSVRWELTVTAPTKGVNFRQDFPITVR